MSMAVDAAWQDKFAARVDLAPTARQTAANGCDRLTGNGDICLNTSLTVAMRPPRISRS